MLPPAVINAELHSIKVEVLTMYQRVSGEMQIRGRLSPTLNDPEPIFHLHNIAAEPLLPGAPRLQNIADGLFRKPMVGAVVPIDPEPPSPDDIPDKKRRYIFFQGSTFNVRASVEFPTAADPAATPAGRLPRADRGRSGRSAARHRNSCRPSSCHSS